MKIIEKFSLPTLIIGMLNKNFLVFMTITYFFQRLAFNGQSDVVKITALIVWGVIGLAFIFNKAISNLINKGELKVDLKATAQAGGKI